MRYKKIRGHKRRHKQLEKWRLRNLDIREDLIETYQSDHVDIVVHPWCDSSLTNSAFPEPKRKTKQLILSGLIDIYDSWKIQLDKLGKPYYLKIWIFEPRFSKSQVVCAINKKIKYYKESFIEPEKTKIFNANQYGQLDKRMKNFMWEQWQDGDYYDNNLVGNPEDYATTKDYYDSKEWFESQMKKTHKTEILEKPENGVSEYYFFKKGDLWIGEK